MSHSSQIPVFPCMAMWNGCLIALGSVIFYCDSADETNIILKSAILLRNVFVHFVQINSIRFYQKPKSKHSKQNYEITTKKEIKSSKRTFSSYSQIELCVWERGNARARVRANCTHSIQATQSGAETRKYKRFSNRSFLVLFFSYFFFFHLVLFWIALYFYCSASLFFVFYFKWRKKEHCIYLVCCW